MASLGVNDGFSAIKMLQKPIKCLDKAKNL